jgi:heme exporter protein A
MVAAVFVYSSWQTIGPNTRTFNPSLARAQTISVTPYLQARGLSCERDRRLLFERLDLELCPGDMLQVSGANGSGKTSLLRLLAGLSPATAGSVTLNGGLLWLGHATGIKGLLSAEENLTWLCALHAPASRAQVAQALRAVGLGGVEEVPCHSLSAGQQRRVALARLYLPGPPLWVLDEPFGALDAAAVTQLEGHLAQHCAAGGMVLLTTHHALAQRPATYREVHLGRQAA